MDYYVKIFSSPRSNTLPDEYDAQVIDLSPCHNSLFSIFESRNRFRVNKMLRKLKKSEIWIEYSGNLFANIYICYCLIWRKNKIFIDCHNSGIELTKGIRLRVLLSLFHLKILQSFSSIKLVVHNSAIQKKVPGSIVVYTPYPKLPKVKKRCDINDVLFLCSLNPDEPLDLILLLCKQLKELGFVAKISGDPFKVSRDIYGEFLFDTYLSYEEYLSELYNTKLTISLTNRFNTLLYAPREAVALGVTCLVNDSSTNKDFYKENVLYSPLDADLLLKNALRFLMEEGFEPISTL
ncbi:hypothetical protein OAH99_00500 [Planktomarina sp.]|nr:hypothetical protein [Planktomarina sp.]